MIKALAIVPYEGLFEMMKEVTREVEDIQLHLELGNLYEGVAIAKDAEREGYHVIISRGGTASLIQEAVSIPVIDIQVSGYDVLRILTLVKGFSQKAAIVGFSNITHGASTICKLLDFEIKTLTITKETEVKETLMNLKNRNYEVVIGDVVTVRVAKELGLTGVLITSGREAIMDALEEARRSYRIYSQLQQDVTFYQSILNSDDQAIAVIDREECIVYENERFNREFQWNKLKSTTNLPTLIQETVITREKIIKTVPFNDLHWKVTICPMDDQVVLFFEKNLPNQAAVQTGEKNLNAIELHTTAPYIPFSGKSEQVQQVMKQIEAYSKKEEPVWISGEEGNGKAVAAHSIFFKRESVNKSFFVLHGELLHQDQLEDLMNEDFFLTYANSVVFLNKIDKINTNMQKELYQILQNEISKSVKWVASSEGDIEEKVKNGTFHAELYYILAPLKIHIPPLRERRQDIEDLVHVFISELHPKYGNGVVGIRQDALEEISNYNWPGNVAQLKQIIEQLFIQSHSYYIEKEEVVAVIKQFEQQVKKDDLSAQIDISGTLEEIEKQVINKVLEEEGLNQSKTAKRLGINRSTLWRKLK